MTFIQTIEFKTSQPDEIEALVSKYRAETGSQSTALRGTFTEDRDQPGTYIQIVEFPSYEAAKKNSDMPRTAEFAQTLASLCDGAPTFRNLDVRSVEEMQ